VLGLLYLARAAPFEEAWNMKTQRERDQEKRDQRLRDMNEAVEDGRLVIRRMTQAERKRFPPKERTPRRSS
jgi:hypothetical protein